MCSASPASSLAPASALALWKGRCASITTLPRRIVARTGPDPRMDERSRGGQYGRRARERVRVVAGGR